MSKIKNGFNILQKFDGTVLSVLDDAFIAKLIDRTSSAPEEITEIPFTKIRSRDQGLIKPGAMFRWVIGYRPNANNKSLFLSIIRFQRLPAWTPVDIKYAKQKTESFLSFIDLKRANNPSI